MPHFADQSLPMRLLLAASLLLCLLILGLHLALLPEAAWQGDDYIEAAFARDYGLAYLWQARLDGWSPRPLSEPILFLYGRLAAASLRPHTVPFLCLLWSLFLAAPLLSARRPVPPLRLLLGLACACLLLLGHPVAEMFYWPAGAVAYLPTLAASSLATFLVLDRRLASRRGLCALSLSLAACAASSEAGAAAALPLAAGLACLERRLTRGLLLLTPALLVCLFVFWVLLHHRAAAHAEMLPPAARPGLAAALRRLPALLGRDVATAPLARLLFLAGSLAAWSELAPVAPDRRQRLRLLVVAGCLLAAAGLTLLGSLLQFGLPCCERHDSLRQGWVVLALTALGAAASRFRPGPARAVAPLLLALACLVGVAPRLLPIARDLRRLPAIDRAAAADWRAGRQPGADLVIRRPPSAQIAGPVELPLGTFHEPAGAAWAAHGVMLFFGKRTLTVLP